MFGKSGFRSGFMAIALGATTLASQAPGSEVSDRARVAVQREIVTPGGKVSINPQPLPPRVQQQTDVGADFRMGSRIMINPQPLPPKSGTNSIR